VASNPGQIPAGGKDVISVVVNTKNRGGGTLRKRFRVNTNDPANASLILQVKGEVRSYIPVKPKRVRLRGRVGEQVQKTVQIERLKDHPFRVKAIKARNGQNLQFELKEGNGSKDGYSLVVTNTMKEAGTYHDLITIETDSKAKPKLQIPVTGRILAVSKK
jgi:hypothetical protein